MSIMDKLKKNSKLDMTATLAESKLFLDRDCVKTPVPMVNVALSADVDGGLSPGLTVLAGPSKHFKSAFSLLMAAAYLKQHPDAVMVFYINEFGSPMAYFQMFGIDPSRVLVKPIVNIEELKFDLVSLLENDIQRGDKLVIVIDSVGNLASKKELEDALAEKSAADMSRAKALKGLFRMVTPFLTLKNIPLIVINHTYKEIGMFPKDVVSGGTGIYYSADNIWIIGRQQDKVGTEIKGYHFVINIEKSRYVKEKSKIPISVSWEEGVLQYSGLLEVALAGNFVTKPSNGWYQKMDPETGEVVGQKYREKDIINSGEFWEPILADKRFKEFVINTYAVGRTSIVDPSSIVEVADD